MCERWLKFENFLADVGPRPSSEHTLDRYPDNNGPYEPGNVRWATCTEQARNRRSSRTLTYQGHTRTIAEWAEISGLAAPTLYYRLSHGWTAEHVLEIPVGATRYRHP